VEFIEQENPKRRKEKENKKEEERNKIKATTKRKGKE